MIIIGQLLLFLSNLYIWVIIASVAVSWLIAFDVLKASNPQAQNLVRLLARATDPVYKPLRKYVPPIAGLDITPIIVIFGIMILQHLIVRVFMVPSYL